MSETYPPGGWTTRVRKRVRAVLAEHDLTAAEVARRVGWSQSYISRRLAPSSPTPFSVADLEAIAGALGVTPTDLLPADRKRVAA